MPRPNEGLSGVGVLVTRPAHQAEPLCQLIEEAGGKPVRFPAMEIVAAEHSDALKALVRQLSDFDIAIFISPNAVQKAVNLVRSYGEFPASLRIAAVGRGSARALEKQGLKVDIFPATRFDSEALLAMDEMRDVSAKRIIIFRGEGGREMLAETLKARGAKVEYAEVYQRVMPEADATHLMRAWAHGDIHIVTVTSSESLRNLYDMLGQLGRRWLQQTPLVVVSERTAELAKELGFKKYPIVAERASDDAIVDAVRQWWMREIAS